MVNLLQNCSSRHASLRPQQKAGQELCRVDREWNESDIHPLRRSVSRLRLRVGGCGAYSTSLSDYFLTKTNYRSPLREGLNDTSLRCGLHICYLSQAIYLSKTLTCSLACSLNG